MKSFPTTPGLDEQARAAAAALSSEQLADVRQHFLGYFASLRRINCTGRRREIQRKLLRFLVDAAVDTETDAELAQYLMLACLLHEQQNLPEHLTTAGAAIAEAILTLSDISIRLPRRSHGEAKTGQS
ncbi:MAG: hypothetical protein IJX33_10455 [Akkermansia sp.]|nr:hypothetical protein [Akkermansia sp.]MBQ8516483.1 hypothetical protein [Akkermansia sp.]